jgi:hypothetical protein
MATKKKIPAKTKIDLRPRQDETAEPADLSLFRILPYPLFAALQQFHLLGMQPPDPNVVFVPIAIGPNTGDLYALGCVGIFPVDKKDPKSPRGVEILNAFAVSDDSYVALCEAIRAICMPFGYQIFAGDVNMISQTQPYRVIGHKPFYQHVDPKQRPM